MKKISIEQRIEDIMGKELSIDAGILLGNLANGIESSISEERNAEIQKLTYEFLFQNHNGVQGFDGRIHNYGKQVDLDLNTFQSYSHFQKYCIERESNLTNQLGRGDKNLQAKATTVATAGTGGGKGDEEDNSNGVATGKMSGDSRIKMNENDIYFHHKYPIIDQVGDIHIRSIFHSLNNKIDVKGKMHSANELDMCFSFLGMPSIDVAVEKIRKYLDLAIHLFSTPVEGDKIDPNIMAKIFFHSLGESFPNARAFYGTVLLMDQTGLNCQYSPDGDAYIIRLHAVLDLMQLKEHYYTLYDLYAHINEMDVRIVKGSTEKEWKAYCSVPLNETPASLNTEELEDVDTCLLISFKNMGLALNVDLTLLIPSNKSKNITPENAHLLWFNPDTLIPTHPVEFGNQGKFETKDGEQPWSCRVLINGSAKITELGCGTITLPTIVGEFSYKCLGVYKNYEYRESPMGRIEFKLIHMDDQPITRVLVRPFLNLDYLKHLLLRHFLLQIDIGPRKIYQNQIVSDDIGKQIGIHSEKDSKEVHLNTSNGLSQTREMAGTGGEDDFFQTPPSSPTGISQLLPLTQFHESTGYVYPSGRVTTHDIYIESTEGKQAETIHHETLKTTTKINETDVKIPHFQEIFERRHEERRNVSNGEYWEYILRFRFCMPQPPRLLVSCLSVFVKQQTTGNDDLRIVKDLCFAVSKDMMDLHNRLIAREKMKELSVVNNGDGIETSKENLGKSNKNESNEIFEISKEQITSLASQYKESGIKDENRNHDTTSRSLCCICTACKR